MKLQALLVAIAVAAGGSALAASDTAQKDGKPTADTQTTTQHKVVKTKKTTSKVTRKSTHAAKRDSTQRMGAASRRANEAPETDLTARDRQSRIDEAYNKWRSTHS